jgi:flagellar hook assembly protein FlgD/DNA/RNA endonuclease YhcR with UshA esterase domain
MKLLSTLCLTVLVLALLCGTAQQAAADVFAHNVRVTQPTSNDPFDAKFNDGTGAAIRFVLSDHADSVLVMISNTGGTIRTLKATNLPSGDTLVVWDGNNFMGVPVPSGDYSIRIAAYDKGYNAYTEIFYEQPAIFTRGVTAIRNDRFKNFGFIYSADNGGYATGVARHSADGRLWGNSKGVAKLDNTGAVVGPANLRYSSEADDEGYVYLIGRDNKQIFRYHTDTLNVVMVDSGGYTTNLEGLAIGGEGSGRVMMVAGNSKVYFAPIGASTWFQPKTVAIDGDSTVVFWDVQFGADSIIFATFYGAKDNIAPGVAKFNFSGWDGTTPKKLADAQWTVTVDSGRGNTMALAHGKDSTGAGDQLYFTIARRKSGDGNVKQNIYVIKSLYGGTPTLDTVYKDKQNNMTGSRSDIAVDAVGNVIYFENSNEEVVLISPPTGPNTYTTNSLAKVKVIVSETIGAVRRQTIDLFKPDRLNDTVTVIGTVVSMNPTASANRFQYFIQDATGGINVTKGSVTGGGPVYKFGDRLVVKGVVGQNRGTTQLNILNMADVQLLDSNNAVTPQVLTIPQFLANAEKYESQLIKFIGVAKTATSVAWPAAGADANMTITDGVTSLLLRIDLDMELDGTTEPVYPMSVQGVATQFTSSASVYNDGYQITPSWVTDITGGINAPPNRYFSLLAPAHTSRVVLNDTAQVVTFRWRAAIDLNGDNVIYQWLPVGGSAVPTTNAAKDTFLVRTGKQMLTYLGAADSVQFKWSVATKDPTNPVVYCIDTNTVTIVRGTITDVDGRLAVPTQFSLDQNYPNPFNPSTTIRFGLPVAASVRLTVYDALGREVATLVNGEMAAGFQTMTWNATNHDGARVASGVYFYRLQAQQANGNTPFVELRKMLLVK